MTQDAPSPVRSDVSGDVIRLVALRSEALSTDEVLTAVADRTAGGVTLFSGLVRDHDHGVAVERLEYVAHPTAADRLREVVEQVAADFEVVGLAAVHRTGLLEIGETAVLVAASAAHRDTAYAASRALIDRLKAEVPIWKRQEFADGGEEWVAP